ncbi:phasin [Kaistia hirudinis]|uniref:Phasin n=1 Tax=Kaistia hirudinis TaxID=1293440 RepID=A0A840AJ92_9HYPH|nr:TIGR01841 family phasin [Kaistia hirudinis]MBB3930409.1 phasin [Kaistia hirudinis]
MADKTAFEIPEPMRTFADKSVDQAKKAFDDFMTATVKAIDKAETSAKSLQSGTQDLNRQAIGFVEENVAATFEFAQKLVRAKTIEEFGELQKEFLAKQAEAVRGQSQNLTEMMGRVASDAATKAKG